MQQISTTEFRSNQTKYFGMVAKGDEVVIRTKKMGSFRIVPVVTDEQIMEANHLTREELDSIRRGMEEADRGEVYPIEDLEDIWASIM